MDKINYLTTQTRPMAEDSPFPNTFLAPGILVCYDDWDYTNKAAGEPMRSPGTIWRVVGRSHGSFYDLELVDHPASRVNIRREYLRHHMPRTWREKRTACALALGLLPPTRTQESDGMARLISAHYGTWRDPALSGRISRSGKQSREAENALTRNGVLTYVRKKSTN